MSELPQKIGPYRVLQRLGAGGMGEVFLAHDERLDRQVAVKGIRPDAKLASDQRERFRREARVAARLNHPAIVQVYDILQEEDVEHIVMEYVEGTTLRALTSQGPLELPLALRLAREIADGLDAAHHEGIVHRDLKTENVLVTHTGHAKISDFGIAKRLLAGPEPELTGTNMVLGTYRTMSPEQARGEAVDHRSDLFSFGILLYEILTGRSPFAAENALATLNRILFSTPAPVRTLRPEVPEEVSLLVDQLLQKDPFLRPRSAGEVRRQLDALFAPGTAAEESPTVMEPGTFAPSGARSTPRPPSVPPSSPPDSALTPLKHRPRRLALLAVGGLLLIALASAGAWLAFRKPAPPLYVAVLAPEVGTGAGAAEAELLASGVRVAILQALVDLERVSPLSSDEVDAVTGSPRQIAQALSAGEVVSSRLDCRPETCRVSLNRLRGADGSVLWAESLEVPTDDFFLLSQAVTGQIRRGFGDLRPRKAGSTGLEASGRDVRAFLALRRGFDDQSLPLEQVLEDLEEIRRRSPRFLEAYLLEADVLRHRFWTSRRREDLDRAFDLLQEARELSPANPQPLFLWFDVALAGKDLERAEAALEDLHDLVPGDVRVLEREARLLDARGQSQEALTLMRSAARLHPSVRRLSNLAQMEFQQGQITAARGTLQRLLERSPGNLEGLSLLALIELWNGDLQRAAALYRQIVQRSPSTGMLANLGLAYLLLGQYQEAADTFQRTCEREPRNPGFILNLADAKALMGRKAEADQLYRRVAALAEVDPAAATPPLLTIKAQALAHLGEGRGAVSAVQEALRLAPDQGPTVYEAALVYALLGEDHSALANAEKAVQLGLNPRAFSIPWFAALHRSPEFRSLLARAPAP